MRDRIKKGFPSGPRYVCQLTPRAFSLCRAAACGAPTAGLGADCASCAGAGAWWSGGSPAASPPPPPQPQTPQQGGEAAGREDTDRVRTKRKTTQFSLFLKILFILRTTAPRVRLIRLDRGKLWSVGLDLRDGDTCTMPPGKKV